MGYGSKIMIGSMFSCVKGTFELISLVTKLDLEVFIMLLFTVEAKIV